MIRLWKLGDMERGIIPTRAAAEKLSQLLQRDKDGEITDIIWGPDLSVELIPNGPIDAKTIDRIQSKD